MYSQVGKVLNFYYVRVILKNMKEITKAIGEKIREARENKGITQKELGDFLGYSPMGISHFEKGIRELKLSDLEKLSGFFGKNLSFFLSSGVTLFRSTSSKTNHEGVADSLAAFDKFLIERKNK